MQKEDLFLKQLNQFIQFIGYLIDSKSNKIEVIDNNLLIEFYFINDFLKGDTSSECLEKIKELRPEYLKELIENLFNSSKIENKKEKLTILFDIYTEKSKNFNISIFAKLNTLKN